MRTITSKEAQNTFGSFLDTVQREPVMVTRRNRPVGVMLSMENLPAIFDFVDDMRSMIRSGVQQGLAEADAGKGTELTDNYVDQLKQTLQVRIADRQAS